MLKLAFSIALGYMIYNAVVYLSKVIFAILVSIACAADEDFRRICFESDSELLRRAANAGEKVTRRETERKEIKGFKQD